jgi:hypothetical protein
VWSRAFELFLKAQEETFSYLTCVYNVYTLTFDALYSPLKDSSLGMHVHASITLRHRHVPNSTMQLESRTDVAQQKRKNINIKANTFTNMRSWDEAIRGGLSV